jgi:hypothetical protein
MWNWETQNKNFEFIIKLQIFLLSIYLLLAFDIFTISYPPHPSNTYWDFTRTKQGEKKEYTHFLPESKYELSIRGLAQLVDEKSN